MHAGTFSELLGDKASLGMRATAALLHYNVQKLLIEKGTCLSDANQAHSHSGKQASSSLTLGAGIVCMTADWGHSRSGILGAGMIHRKRYAASGAA